MVGLSRPLVFCLKLDSAFEHAHLETPLSMSVCVAVLGEPFSNQAYDDARETTSSLQPLESQGVVADPASG
jgi:hypothetical protein